MNPVLTNLFRAALDITSAERSAYLDAQCSDPALRAQLDALLLAAEQTEPPILAESPKTRCYLSCGAMAVRLALQRIQARGNAIL
jgi:hypothetical protein